jgi:hypothetical protein
MILNALTVLLPRNLHVTAIGIGSALGSAGIMVFPTAAGAIADRGGYVPRDMIALACFVESC